VAITNTETPSPEIQHLEHEIEESRQKMAASIADLREQVVEAADWHLWVKKHPVAFTCAAFAVGYIVGKHLI